MNWRIPIFAVNLFQMFLHGVCSQILMHPKIIGTSLAAATQIQDSLEKREEFVGRHFGGDDPNEKELNLLKDNLKEQAERGLGQPAFDYRNNDDDEINAPEKNTDEPIKKESPLKTKSPLPVKDETVAPEKSSALDPTKKEYEVHINDTTVDSASEPTKETPVPLDPEIGSPAPLFQDGIN